MITVSLQGALKLKEKSIFDTFVMKKKSKMFAKKDKVKRFFFFFFTFHPFLFPFCLDAASGTISPSILLHRLSASPSSKLSCTGSTHFQFQSPASLCCFTFTPQVSPVHPSKTRNKSLQVSLKDKNMPSFRRILQHFNKPEPRISQTNVGQMFADDQQIWFRAKFITCTKEHHHDSFFISLEMLQSIWGQFVPQICKFNKKKVNKFSVLLVLKQEIL